MAAILALVARWRRVGARWGSRMRHKGIMSVSSPYVFVLSDADQRVLQARVRSWRTAHRDRVRAQIVLQAAQGISHAAIAAGLRICHPTLIKLVSPVDGV
jgi:hypothetical protein